MQPSKGTKVQTAPGASGWTTSGLFAICLVVLLLVLFRSSFDPDKVVFSNDGPLGAEKATHHGAPGFSSFLGMWQDSNSLGAYNATRSLNLTGFASVLLGPMGFAKFYAPLVLLFLGFSAFVFFRQLRLSPVACILGGLAAMLNSAFFSVACWGVGPQALCVGLNFLALAALVNDNPRHYWLKTVLAGFAVGLGVSEGADIGALYSLCFGVFAFYLLLTGEFVPLRRTERVVVLCGVIVVFLLLLILVLRLALGFKLFCLLSAIGGALVWALTTKRPLANRVAKVTVRLGLIVLCALFIAAQSVSSFIGIQIKGIAGVQAQQDEQAKAQRWSFATQWSFPKRETLSLFIPGLFGFRGDTPANLPEALQSTYLGGVYWGAVGRDLAWDQYFEGDRKGPPPNPESQFIRYSGGGAYEGVLVALIALWAVLQSFRKKDSVFSPNQRKFLWFWTGLAFVALLLAFGRFAPFFQILYNLPYASSVRSPAKFLSPLNWSVVILFACGVHGLSRRFLEPAGSGTGFKGWWTKAAAFDRRWVFGCLVAIAVGLVGWWIYSSNRVSLVEYLQSVYFGDSMAKTIAAFSIRQVGWFVLFLAASVGVMLLIMLGAFRGQAAKWGGILLGLILVADLVRADLPWLLHLNYKQKYDVAQADPARSNNTVINWLAQKSYEHRVAQLPRWLPYLAEVPQQLQAAEQFFQQLYGFEWTQHLFLYNNIQTLDIVQMPRMPQDLKTFEEALQPRLLQDRTGRLVITPDTAHLVARRWQLTNTRYLLGTADWLDRLNTLFDPVRRRFRIASPFSIGLKPGVTDYTRTDELTAALATNGAFAIFEFTGALPRASLFANWEVPAKDPAALSELKAAPLGTNDLEYLQAVGTNDFLTLKLLTSPAFDPAQLVLVADAPPVPAPGAATNQTSGSVEFDSYNATHIVLTTKADAPTILLLNDKYDPHWQVRVDGQPAPLLRCNYIMRGAYVPAGSHTVDFIMRPPLNTLYVTAAAFMVGVVLLGVVVLSKKPQSVPPAAANPAAGRN